MKTIAELKYNSVEWNMMLYHLCQDIMKSIDEKTLDINTLDYYVAEFAKTVPDLANNPTLQLDLQEDVHYIFFDEDRTGRFNKPWPEAPSETGTIPYKLHG